MDQLPGICWDATKSLFSCAKKRADYVLKLEENLSSLRDKWDQLENIRKDVETKIEDAESTGEMQRRNEVNGWLQRVQKLQQVMQVIEAQAGSQEIHNTCLHGCCPENRVSSYKLGKKVVEMIPKVDELVTSGKRILDKDPDIARKLPPKLVDEMPPVETVGLELMVDTVWKCLEQENVGIIGLYGMGGAGKTTLLKRIQSELGKRGNKFDLVLWAVVSRDCNIGKVMNDIRNRLGVKDDDWDRSNEEQRVAKIFQILKRKRFVLMLDDLWGKLELKTVGVPLPKDTNYQSKVMLTTRSEDVCAKMQADKKFKVECLLENEAFALFCKYVGEETLNSHSKIRELAREIAKECGGLPLALITVGSAMAGVKSVEAWQQARSDLRASPWIASDLEKKVFGILKFSYDRLPDETHRNCFLYGALYPEDYAIIVDELIDRWIGEGFLGKGKYKAKKNIYDMREEGHSIIEKLKLSCLLEDARNWAGNWQPSVKMHDVIRDMALWLGRDQDKNKEKVVVEEEAFVMDSIDSEGLNVVERLSVVGVLGTWQVPVCPNLLTVCVRESRNITDLSNIQCMTRLRVLDLSNNRLIENLPTEIGLLISLEFLDISSTYITRLPIELKNMKKLRVFLVEYILHKVEIPLGVLESLERLQVLRFDGEVAGIREEKEELLLDELECLPALEELGVQLGTITGTHKLLNSAKLQGCLRKFLLYKFEEPLEVSSLLAGWSRMKHLESISLRDVYKIKEISSITYTAQYHLSKLRKVAIFECDSITHLTWLKCAPLLEFLTVLECHSMKQLVKGGQDEAEGTELFSNLRCLRLQMLPKLKSIHEGALPFPSLRAIFIEGCDNLRKLPLNPNSAKDTLVRIIGERKWWSNLEWEDPATERLLHSKFESL